MKIFSAIISLSALLSTVVNASNLAPDLDAIQSIETKSSSENLVLEAIKETLKENPFFIPADKVSLLLKRTNLTIDQLLQQLIPIIKESAIPPISLYKVGAAGLSEKGNIYLGVNLEFPEFQLNQTVHGEQFLVSHVRNHGEKLVKISLSAAPCGHCRQFLNEIGNENLIILTPNSPKEKLATLLIKSFGPKDLKVDGDLLTLKPGIQSKDEQAIVARAIEAAYVSYAPYTKAFSGVAIETHDGKIYSGSYLENAAFNPSLPPLQAALISLIAAGRTYNDIAKVALVEQKEAATKHGIITKALVENIAPKANFTLRNH